MKNYTFNTTTATEMDNTVSLNGHFFKVTDEISDKVFEIINDALSKELAKRTSGASVKSETVAESEPKKPASKSSTKTSKTASTKKTSQKSSSKTSDDDTAELTVDEVNELTANEVEKHIITKVATMTPYGSKGLIVGDVATGTWKAVRQHIVSKFGDDVEYIRQKDDPKGQGHFEFRSKALRDKALNDDCIPVVYWDKRKMNGKKRG